jgi:hypothetical protein
MPVFTAELLLGVAGKQTSTLIERAVAEHWDKMRIRDELQSAQARVTDLSQPRKLPGRTQHAEAFGADTVPAASRPPGAHRPTRRENAKYGIFCYKT